MKKSELSIVLLSVLIACFLTSLITSQYLGRPRDDKPCDCTCNCPGQTSGAASGDAPAGAGPYSGSQKYVCPGGNVVALAEDCYPRSPEGVNPILTNEEGTMIEKIMVAPACVNDFDGGSIYFQAKSLPDNVSVQIKDMSENGGIGGEYYNVTSITPGFDGYSKFILCDGRCPNWAGDFRLQKGKVYLLRLAFDFTSIWGEIQYSNEHIIDTTIHSNYTKQPCRLS